MHLLLPLKIKLRIIVGIVFIITWFASALDLHPLGVGMLVGVVDFIILFGLFSSWPLCAWLLNTCGFNPLGLIDLRGKWTGQLVSQHENSEVDGPIDVQLDLIQSWKDIVFILETERMTGTSVCAVPLYDAATGILTVRYFYRTEPKAESAKNNPPQTRGSAIAQIKIDEPDEIKIRYTNERGLGGEIALMRTQSD